MIRPRDNPKGCNLFPVDLDEIKRRLAEANAALCSRADDLAAAAGRMPDELASPDQTARALRLRDMIREQMKELRMARLDDGRSFTEAVKAIDTFFAGRAAPLDAAQRRVLKALGGAARREAAAPATPAEVMPAPDAPPATVSAPVIAMEWVVSDIDVEAVDLEALRPYIAPYHLQLAATKLLKEQGPREVAGIVYTRRAKA